MSFSTVRSEVNVRFIEVGYLLNTIKVFEDSITPPAQPPLEYKLLKGFFYVHLYACIEFSMRRLITTTLNLIKAKSVRFVDYENGFYTVAAYSNVQSIRDSSSKTFLDKSADLYLAIGSNNLSNFDETLILKYLQNIWGKSFNQVTKTLGASSFAISGLENALFDEIVENRNMVAHGRDTVENVGSGPKYVDLKSKYDKVFDVVSRYISHLEAFYTASGYIKTAQRVNY